MHLRNWLILICLVLMTGSAPAATFTDPTRMDLSRPHLRIHLVYNYAVYTRPIFFKPKSRPSFGIWVKDRGNGHTTPVFVTRKAGLDKWTFTAKRPEAIPVWYGIRDGQEADLNPAIDIDAISSATPKGESATIYWEIPPQFQGHALEIYIEANNSFDFNTYYTKKKAPPSTAPPTASPPSSGGP